MAEQVLTDREKSVVVYRVRALMDYWDITLEELEEASQPPSRPATTSVNVKYRHPVTGATWTGEGAHPEWLRHALLKEGFTVDELKPAATAGTARSPSASTR